MAALSHSPTPLSLPIYPRSAPGSADALLGRLLATALDKLLGDARSEADKARIRAATYDPFLPHLYLLSTLARCSLLTPPPTSQAREEATELRKRLERLENGMQQLNDSSYPLGLDGAAFDDRPSPRFGLPPRVATRSLGSQQLEEAIVAAAGGSAVARDVPGEQWEPPPRRTPRTPREDPYGETRVLFNLLLPKRSAPSSLHISDDAGRPEGCGIPRHPVTEREHHDKVT